jgi:hypothetical protein
MEQLTAQLNGIALDARSINVSSALRASIGARYRSHVMHAALALTRDPRLPPVNSALKCL